MASVQNIAVLVRYFMSTDVTIPPTISVRAHSIPPTIGGDRNDLSPPEVAALIRRHWRARMQALFRCRPLAKPFIFASHGKPERRKCARASHKPHSVASEPPRAFIQSGFNEVRYRAHATSRRRPHRSL